MVTVLLEYIDHILSSQTLLQNNNGDCFIRIYQSSIIILAYYGLML